MSNDTRRLIDQTEDPFERDLLSSASADGPDENARRAVAAALGIAAMTPADAAASTTMATSGVAKLALVTLVGGGLVAGALVLRTPEPPPAPAVVTEVFAPPVPEPIVDEVPEPSPTPPVASPEVAPPKPAPAPKKRVRPSGGLAEQVRLLDHAQAASRAGHHLEALRVLAAYRQKYPTGALAEEAGALRITALADSGQTEEARRVAGEFFELYPNSSHTQRLRTLVR